MKTFIRRSPCSLAVETYAALFTREFVLYPLALIQRSKLKRVVLSSELSFAGQQRNAIPILGARAKYEAGRGVTGHAGV